MKRFYKAVTVGPDLDVRLDDRPVKTPGRATLVLPTPQLADAVAAEWAAQGATIDPRAMPLTGLANAAIDLAGADPAAFAAPLIAYAGADLLCYREARDPVLKARQAAAWNPLLVWAEARFGVEFALVSGVMHVAQPPATVTTLEAAVVALDPFRLAALAPLTTIGGSLVAALGLIEGALDPATTWTAVALDDLYQEERWGEDAEATRARLGRQAEWDAAARFVALL